MIKQHGKKLDYIWANTQKIQFRLQVKKIMKNYFPLRKWTMDLRYVLMLKQQWSIKIKTKNLILLEDKVKKYP